MGLPAWAAPRVGIIDLVHREGLEPALAAALTQQAGVEVIGTAAIAPLLPAEQVANLVQKRWLAELGTFLKADGLLVLENLVLPGGGGHASETVRLVSVENGACLVFLPVRRAGLSITLREWADGFARHVQRVVPMLTVTQADGLPVAVLSLPLASPAPGSLLFESSLRRLVELRIGALPRVVILDRGHFDDEPFQRRLEAGDLPSFWGKVHLINGSSEAAGGGSVQVKLVFRGADGVRVEKAEIAGRTDAVPALAGAIAEAVLKSLARPPLEDETALAAERAAALDEAAWAWRSEDYGLALEALSVARALGEKSPDAAALETWLLIEAAAEGHRYLAGQVRLRELPPLAERRALSEGGLISLAIYRALGGKTSPRLGRLATALEVDTLRRRAVGVGRQALEGQARLGQPLEDSWLRAQVHDAAGLPLEGAAVPDAALLSGIRHASVWVHDGKELIALYEKLLRNDHLLVVEQLHAAFPATPDEALGDRFRQDAATRAAWGDLFKRLCDDPATRLRGLMFASGHGRTPEQEESYRAFLTELGRQGVKLFQDKQLSLYLNAESRHRSWGLTSKFQKERTELAMLLCESLPGFSAEMTQMINYVKAPAGLEQRFWTAFTHYRERCLREVKEQPVELASRERAFAWWQSDVLRNNPAIVVADEHAALAVSRFWNPYGVPEWGPVSLYWHELVISGNSVWMLPLLDAGAEVLEVSVPGFAMRPHRFAVEDPDASLSVTPEAIWLRYVTTRDDDGVREHRLIRRDRRTADDRTYTAPGEGRVYAAGGRVFFNGTAGAQGGLYEFDEKSGEFRMLASPRQKPPKSPLDGRPSWYIAGVIPGPGGEPCVVNGQEPAGLFAIGGTWKKFDVPRALRALRFGEKSLILGGTEEGLFIDPARAEPEWWIAGAQSSVVARARAKWLLPPNFRGSLLNQAAFRDGELFAIRRDAQGRHCLRWWHEGGPREGIEMPLRFELPAADRASIEQYREHIHDVEAACNPARAAAPLYLFTVEQGLVLSNKSDGFWYIPYADLQEYARVALKDPPLPEAPEPKGGRR